MPDVVKPFRVLSIIEEPEGGQGVHFEITKTEFVNDSTNKIKKMTTYISIPAEENIDTYLFNYLSNGGWL